MASPKTPDLLASSTAMLRASAQAAPEHTVRLIPVDDLTGDPDQPRQDFGDSIAHEDDTKGTFADLVASIKQNGVLQPLIVFRDPASDRLLVLAGERRLRAAREAGLTHVPCLEKTSIDVGTKLRLQLTENRDRKDLTLYEVAAGIGRLLALSGEHGDKTTLAEQLHMSPSRLSDFLFLVSPKALPDTRSALRRQLIIDVVTARNFNKLSDEDRAQLIKEATENRRPIRRSDIANLHRQQSEANLDGDPEAQKTAAMRLPAPTPPSAEEDDAPPVATPRAPRAPADSAARPAAAGQELPSAGDDEHQDESTAQAAQPEPRFRLPALTRGQLEVLFVLLGAPGNAPESDDEIEATFLALLDQGPG